MKQSPDSPDPNANVNSGKHISPQNDVGNGIGKRWFFAASTTSLLTGTPSSTDLSWRILALVNLFRLLLPLVLGVLFVSIEPTPVGQLHPAIFAGVVAGYFLFGITAISSIRARWPALVVQAAAQGAIDILAVAAVIYSNGPAGTGFAALEATASP